MSVQEYISRMQHPLVMAFGNPLLDTIVLNENDRLRALMERFALKLDGAVEMERDQIQELFNSLPENLPRNTVAGGSALNTMRFLERLIGKGDRKTCVYYGSIGNDERGRRLRDLVAEANVDARLGVVNGYPTGRTLAVVTNENRSFAANIGAASRYSEEMLKNMPLPLDKVKILYIEGFFLTHNAELAVQVAKMAEEKKIVIAFNLSAEYIIEQHERAVLDIMPYADVIFGNANEFKALAKTFPISWDLVTDIPYHLNSITRVSTANELLPSVLKTGKSWLRKNTAFVMTQGGAAPPMIIYGDNEAVGYNISTNLAVRDTTGAGDALVAGFLAGVLAGQAPGTCLNWGCRTAEQVIQQYGAMLPSDLPDDFLQMGPGSIGHAIFE